MKLNWERALLLLLVLEILLFGTLNPRMLDINMLLFSTSDFICIGIVALPLTLVIISGGIDISLGSTIGLCAIALGVMMQSGVPMAAAIPLTLLLGLLCGLFNALLIHYTGISPLVITLGTLYLYGGGALLLPGTPGAPGSEGICFCLGRIRARRAMRRCRLTACPTRSMAWWGWRRRLPRW